MLNFERVVHASVMSPVLRFSPARAAVRPCGPPPSVQPRSRHHTHEAFSQPRREIAYRQPAQERPVRPAAHDCAVRSGEGRAFVPVDPEPVEGLREADARRSLINLAKAPASTLQILGAEKALFR